MESFILGNMEFRKKLSWESQLQDTTHVFLCHLDSLGQVDVAMSSVDVVHSVIASIPS